MGDWRAQGNAVRRRQGAPSHHSGGAMPDAPRWTSYEDSDRTGGFALEVPEGTAIVTRDEDNAWWMNLQDPKGSLIDDAGPFDDATTARSYVEHRRT